MLGKNYFRKFVTLTTTITVWCVYSMVALAVPNESAGEITVSGQVTVNGQTMSISGDGSLHEEIPSEDGHTTVDISVDGSQSSTSVQSHSTSSGSSSINISTHSRSEGGSD